MPIFLLYFLLILPSLSPSYPLILPITLSYPLTSPLYINTSVEHLLLALKPHTHHDETAGNTVLTLITQWDKQLRGITCLLFSSLLFSALLFSCLLFSALLYSSLFFSSLFFSSLLRSFTHLQLPALIYSTLFHSILFSSISSCPFNRILSDIIRFKFCFIYSLNTIHKLFCHTTCNILFYNYFFDSNFNFEDV